MPKYRGFMNEVSLGHYDSSPISGGSNIDRFQFGNLGAAFSGPRQVAYVPPSAPVVVAAPAPVQPNGITRLVPYGGIPGDIRPPTARIGPVDALMDEANFIDDMTGENGVPGVDDSGGFPYGDPRTVEITATKPAPQNFVPLAIAAAIAFALFGG